MNMSFQRIIGARKLTSFGLNFRYFHHERTPPFRDNPSFQSSRYVIGFLCLAASSFSLKSMHDKMTQKSGPDEDDGNNSIEKQLIKKNGDSKDQNFDKKNEKILINEAIDIAKDLICRKKDEDGTPGIVVAVSVDNKHIWSEGFGYADVENRVPCSKDTVMRVASISKSISTVIAGKLIENGKLDIDAPIQKYASEFPIKTFDGKQVTITTRQLLSHLSGVRNYEKDREVIKKNKEKAKKKKLALTTEEKEKDSHDKENSSVYYFGKEYYLKEEFNEVRDALRLFQDDELIYKPGSTFLYSTHGFTLVSRVIEGASGYKFPYMARQFLRKMDMNSSYLDENEPIIYNRARCYQRGNGKLVNCPYVDNSYKWAGGGFLSTVEDLNIFGNHMLYCYQNTNSELCEKCRHPAYLKQETVKELWTPVKNTAFSSNKKAKYGLGWIIVSKKDRFNTKQRFFASHTGAAIGASSVLIILPRDNVEKNEHKCKPQGVVVSMITNLSGVDLMKTAYEIAELFEKGKVD